MHETSQRRQNRQSQQRNNHLRRRQVLYRIYRNARARPGFCLFEKKYKKTPEMVVDFVNELQISRTDKTYLHFARIDKIPSFDEVEGLLFLPTPDILSGLATWTFFDNNASDAVAAHSAPAVAPSLPKPSLKTGNKGNALSWDSSTPPSAHTSKRTYWSFTIPMSRFKEMYHTMRESCLFDTHAWGKIREGYSCPNQGTHILLSHFLPHPSGHLSAGNQNRRCPQPSTMPSTHTGIT